MQGKIVLWLVLLPSVFSLRAGDAPLDRATLRGVKALNVIVDPLPAELKETGVSQQMLRSRISERLRQAGITVDSEATEFLGLRLDATPIRKGPYSLCFALGFYQRVLLARDQTIKTATQTWDVNTMLVVAPKPLADAALHTAEQLTDQFINAYHFVNPR
jgi:hypothetical protein